MYILPQLKTKTKRQLVWHACVHACMLSHAQLFTIPWTVACQAFLSMGFPRQEHWSGLPVPSQRAFSNPGTKPTSPALASRLSATETPGKSSTSLSGTLNIRKRKMEGVKRSLRLPVVST